MIVNPDDLSCKELVELVTAYLDDRLPEADRARFEMHLSYCLWCRDYLDQFRATLRLAASVDEDALPAAARDGLLAAFRGYRRGQEGGT